MMTIPVYDLARVEIMRGPQGTTFGRNATLGLMHFFAARPTQDTEAEVQATVGSPDLLSFKGHYSGALSDTVSERIAFNYEDRDGNITSAQRHEKGAHFGPFFLAGCEGVNPSFRASFSASFRASLGASCHNRLKVKKCRINDNWWMTLITVPVLPGTEKTPPPLIIPRMVRR